MAADSSLKNRDIVKEIEAERRAEKPDGENMEGYKPLGNSSAMKFARQILNDIKKR